MPVFRASGKLMQTAGKKTATVSHASQFTNNLSSHGKELLKRQLNELNPDQDDVMQMANIYFWVAARCVEDEGVTPKHLRALCSWVSVKAAQKLDIDLSSSDHHRVTELFYQNIVVGKVLKPEAVFTQGNFMTQKKTRPSSAPPTGDVESKSPASATLKPVIRARAPMSKSHTRHIDQQNAMKSSVDPRKDSEKIFSMQFFKVEMTRIDELYETFKLINSQSLVQFVDVYSEDLCARYSHQALLEQTRQCGFPDNEAFYCLFAVTAAYCAMKLSKRRNNVQQKEMMESGLNTAFVYPPPDYKPLGAFARKLEQKYWIKLIPETIQSTLKSKEPIMSQTTAQTASSTDAAQASSSNSTQENIMSDTQTQDNTAQSAGAADATAGGAQAEAGKSTGDNQTNSSGNPEKTEKKAEKSISSGEWFTTANVVSSLFCVLLAGLAFTGMHWLLSGVVAPWLISLGMAGGLVVGICAAMGAAIGAVVGYGIYTIFNWTVSLFEDEPKSEKAAAPAQQADENVAAATAA